MIRPELARRLHPWREVIAAAMTGGFGIWIFTRGGLLFQPLGLAILALAAVWGLTARRKMRFLRGIDAPGLVELDEGAIRYYAPDLHGGELPVRDLSEIRLLSIAGRPHWRLRTIDAQALLIPVEAAGAERLADAFAALPGIDMGRVIAALDTGASDQTVWTRTPTPRLT